MYEARGGGILSLFVALPKQVDQNLESVYLKKIKNKNKTNKKSIEIHPLVGRTSGVCDLGKRNTKTHTHARTHTAIEGSVVPGFLIIFDEMDADVQAESIYNTHTHTHVYMYTLPYILAYIHKHSYTF